MFALIFENKVVEISENKFPVSKPMKWIECDDKVKIEWFHDGKKFKRSLKPDNEALEEEKIKKVLQTKSARDQKNIEPITDCKAFILDEEGNKTAKESYFLFYTNRHPTNPASDPEAIISRVLDLGVMPYFTEDIDGNKIVVELTPEIARSLRQLIAQKNNQNYKISYAIEAVVKNAKTSEEVEAISNQISN